MTPAREPLDRPLVRRDADGNERTASSWEALSERLIREAQQGGAFDDLPGQGRPLELDDERYAGEMAAANRMLRNAGAAPPWIETDKEVRRRRAAIEALLARAERSHPVALQRLLGELEALADAHDDAVDRLEGLAPTPRQQRARLDRGPLRSRVRAAVGRDPR